MAITITTAAAQQIFGYLVEIAVASFVGISQGQMFSPVEASWDMLSYM